MPENARDYIRTGMLSGWPDMSRLRQAIKACAVEACASYPMRTLSERASLFMSHPCCTESPAAVVSLWNGVVSRCVPLQHGAQKKNAAILLG